MTGEHPHRALTFVEFIYATRIASIAYVGPRGVPVRRFVLFDAVDSAFWLAVLIPIGFVIGLGLDRMGADLQPAEWIVLGIVLTAATVQAIRR